MKTRQAKKSDVDTVGQLILSSAPVSLAAIFGVNDEFSALNFLHASFSFPDGQYGYANHWVAEIDNQIVGCLSPWHDDLPATFHQATLTALIGFYGIDHTLAVVQTSQALQDCIPKPQKYEWCVGHFAVLPQYQKQGVGTALLELMQQQALLSSKLALSLDVDCGNMQAINFYLHQGFIEISESGVSPRMQALGIRSHIHLSKKL
jgi:GNAT superfamily N-acetyltransferase